MKALNPDDVFTPAVTKAFSEDDVIVVKHAKSGQLIRLWAKDWQAPDGEKPKGRGPNGRHYDTLMKLVAEAMEGKPTPVSVSFVWMQGEADGNHIGYGERYEAALESLLTQLEEDLQRSDIDFILGRISDFGNDSPEKHPSWNLVREAQVSFVEKQPTARAWIDTDDLNDQRNGKNGLHYPKKGYHELAQRFADKAIAMIKDNQ